MYEGTEENNRVEVCDNTYVDNSRFEMDKIERALLEQKIKELNK